MTIKYLNNSWKYDPTTTYNIMKFVEEKRIVLFIKNSKCVPSEYIYNLMVFYNIEGIIM